MSYQEGQRARSSDNPGMRGSIEAAAQRYAALAEKLEARRKRSPSGWAAGRLANDKNAH
jgi:hypothetical protein